MAASDLHPPKVFISHSWTDKPLVLELEEALRQVGAAVWVDHAGIRGGDSLPKRISDALEWCDTLLLVWSQDSSKSTWVALEWENAISLRKKIIPCLLDGTKLPGILAHKANINFRDTETGKAALLRALGLDTPPPAYVPPPPEETEVPSPGQVVVRLRSMPVEYLSADAITVMLQEKEFFDKHKNIQGRGLQHQYERVERNGADLVIDHATGLTWQRSGSKESMRFADTTKYIDQLNRERFAGYGDWRLPTLEEVMSLMEPTKKNGFLYIDPVFDKTMWIWTADKEDPGVAWLVYFPSGSCSLYDVGINVNVRAVRSGQS